MASRRPVPIQPWPSTSGGTSAPGWNGQNDHNDHNDPDPQPSKARKIRAAVLVACDPCRRLKSKCDGERPACRRCVARNKSPECTYELPHDVLSRSSARKEITTQLQRENLDLRQLFHDLSKRPETEAYAIFQRLRSVDDPVALARSIRQAELLLPRPAPQDRGGFTTLQQLDLDALEKSPIKIPARPWTSVAGDGIVSELISAWFKWDDAFLYAFVDRDCFIRDLRAADPERATYCSAFLVNAICALRSYFSDTVDTARHITKKDMREQFLCEAKKQYDSGAPNLPTIQGLWILFAISSLKGEDRAGSLYRFASYGLLKRARVQQIYWSLTDADPDDAWHKRAISKTTWGIFCLESMTAINFRDADIAQPPKIPCLFPEFSYKNPVNVDLFGQPFATSRMQPPFVVGAVNTLCQLAVLMSEIVEYSNSRKDHEGSGPCEEDDVRRRKEYYSQVNTIGDSLPPALRHDHNLTPQTCFLGVTMNTVVYAILRSLHPDVVFDTNDGTSVKSTILKHCEFDAELMERYFETWTTGEFSPMTFIAPLNSGTALLPLLPDERARHIFPRICRLMHILAARMPIARYVLKGWQAALYSRKLDIPGPARPYFQNLGDDDRDDFTDLPTDLIVAHVPNFEEELNDEWDDGELGFMLKKWNEMSVE